MESQGRQHWVLFWKELWRDGLCCGLHSAHRMRRVGTGDRSNAEKKPRNFWEAWESDG